MNNKPQKTRRDIELEEQGRIFNKRRIKFINEIVDNYIDTLPMMHGDVSALLDIDFIYITDFITA